MSMKIKLALLVLLLAGSGNVFAASCKKSVYGFDAQFVPLKHVSSSLAWTQWVAKVTNMHGPIYADATLARDVKVKCRRIPFGWSCTVNAKPCRS